MPSMSTCDLKSPAVTWYLAGKVDESGPVRKLPINTQPFQVGRQTGLSLSLPQRTVSSLHAEIIEQDGALLLRDLNSTNGTFINGKRTEGTAPLATNDLVQFADVVFRLGFDSDERPSQTIQNDVCDRALALLQFDKLMTERAVVPFFQPIINLHDEQPMGYEVLARSRLVALRTPSAMFLAASQLNLESELSRMFRWEGVETCMSYQDLPHLFLNTHPSEMADSDLLLFSLRDIRELSPDQPITLEIHESAVTDVSLMHKLQAELQDLDIRVAYDDFGAGQARFIELVEVRPDYLKFDMTLIQGIHEASERRQQMLAALVRMARELEISPLAEGVECEAEADVCRQMGFDLCQGFYYGKPAPASVYFKAN